MKTVLKMVCKGCEMVDDVIFLECLVSSLVKCKPVEFDGGDNNA